MAVNVSLEGGSARIVLRPQLTSVEQVCQAINSLSPKFTSKPAQGNSPLSCMSLLNVNIHADPVLSIVLF